MNISFRLFAFAAIAVAVFACKQDDPFRKQAEPQPCQFSILNATTSGNIDIQIRRGDSAISTIARNLPFGTSFPSAGYMNLITYDTTTGDTAQPAYIRVIDAVTKNDVMAWQRLTLSPKNRQTMYLVQEELAKPPVSIDNFQRAAAGKAQLRFINFNKNVASAHLLLFGADSVISIRDTGYSTASAHISIPATHYTIVFLSGNDTLQKIPNFLFSNKKTYSFHLLKNGAGNAVGGYTIKD